MTAGGGPHLLSLKAAHAVELHELGRALKNQPRALDVLDAGCQPLDVVIIEEQRPDERRLWRGLPLQSLLAALNISSENTETLTSAATDWAHFS